MKLFVRYIHDWSWGGAGLVFYYSHYAVLTVHRFVESQVTGLLLQDVHDLIHEHTGDEGGESVSG